MEERVRRQAAGVGGDVESVLKDVGLAEDDETAGGTMKKKEAERVWLHCNVGGVEMKGKERDSADEVSRVLPLLEEKRRVLRGKAKCTEAQRV